MNCKIVFVGGGSLRTLGIIRDWVLQGEIAEGSRVCVMDLDARRVRIISALAQQMPEIRDTGIEVDGTADLGEALEGADFVYVVIRAGGVDGMTRDKRIGLKYGFHGHDDFGPSAAMIVLRTVPVVLKIAAEMKQRCPDAWMLNFANPVPFIVRAVRDYSKIKVMGFCGGDQNQLWDIPRLLGWDWEKGPNLDFTYRGVGIDHFCWTTELYYKGEDFYPRLLDEIARMDLSAKIWWLQLQVELLQLYGLWSPVSGHCLHWTHHEVMVEDLRKSFAPIDAGKRPARADAQAQHMDSVEGCIGKDLGASFWEQESLKQVISPVGRPAAGIRAIGAMLRDSGEEMMLNMRAPGAVDNLQDEGIVLLSAKLFRDGPHPCHFRGVPDGIAPLTRLILDYQKALVHAALRGTRRDLESAVFMDPHMRDVGRVRGMLDELLEASRDEIRPELLKW